MFTKIQQLGVALLLGAIVGAAANAAVSPKQAREAQFTEIAALKVRLAASNVTTAEVARAVLLVMEVQGWPPKNP